MFPIIEAVMPEINSLRKACLFCIFSWNIITVVMKNETQFQALLEKSKDCFIRYGIKSTAIDDIARELGVSKKTIYIYVDGKTDLVSLLLSSYLRRKHGELDAAIIGAENRVDAMIQMTFLFFSMLKEATPHLSEIKKHYPDCWTEFCNFCNGYCKEIVSQNLTEGIKEGIYRSTLKIDIIAQLQLCGLVGLLNQEVFPKKKYQPEDIYSEFLNYHLQGILADKGLMLLKKSKLKDKGHGIINSCGASA